MDVVLVIIFLVIIVALSLVIWWQHKNYVKPVKDIKQAAQRIYDGDFSVRIFIKNKNETGSVCALINKIADQYLALQQKLEDKSKELERTTKSLDNFAYVVSHDLKAPFNSIKSIAELLRMEYNDKFDESGRELLHFIDIKVNEMDKLLVGILQYSRVRQSEEKVEPVDLNQEINEVINEIKPPANVQVEIKNPLPTVHIEKDLIHKVFQNLVENAVKYSNKTEGHIDIGSEKHDNLYTFYVSDNGKGIDPKYFEKIFNIFYSIQEPDTEPTGSGVGLAIVKKIIEYKGGQVWVDSEVKKGSTFYFTLPANGSH